MKAEKIQVQAVVLATVQKVWDSYTLPEHITQWNFADPSWHCPLAANDVRVGGEYLARMEARDGSFGFDFKTRYTEVEMGSFFAYDMEDGRQATVTFTDLGDQTEVVIVFDAETENTVELQRNGWQAILNNFKNYTEHLGS